MSFYCEDTKEEAKTYTEYLQTKHWKNISKVLYKKYRYQCAVCGANNGLQVHHKTYDRVGKEELADLVYLCRACHFTYHNNKELFENLTLVNIERGSSSQKNTSKKYNRKLLETYEEWATIHNEDKIKSSKRLKAKRKANVAKRKGITRIIPEKSS